MQNAKIREKRAFARSWSDFCYKNRATFLGILAFCDLPRGL